jgi:hypothetical protein
MDDQLIDKTMHEWNDHVMAIKVVGGKVYALQAFMFTYGVLLDLSPSFYEKRYCFGNLADAKIFWDAFDGTQVPVIGENGCTAIK